MTIFFALVLIAICVVAFGRPTEDERVRLWHEAGNVWPPNWQPETEAYKQAMDFREREIMNMTHSRERWENWVQFVSGRLPPRFTEVGFEVVQTPPHVHEKLSKAVAEAIKNFDSIRSEGRIDVIYHDDHSIPKFVDLGTLSYETMRELKPMHEEWSGVKLEASSAYGIRLYLNSTSLVMHYDKIETHVISSIVHVAHEYDDDTDPWPIQIEDHNGKLHNVVLEPGQMLFYESAVCLHGRMTPLHGKYYGSIFIHYRPTDRSIWNYDVEQTIASIPPHWNEGTKDLKEGSRWKGAGITTDSRSCQQAPPRKLNGKVTQTLTWPETDPDFWPYPHVPPFPGTYTPHPDSPYAHSLAAESNIEHSEL